MKRWFKWTRVRGVVSAPPSKSVAQRYLALALLGRGTTRLMGAGRAEDVLAAADIVSGLGGRAVWEGDGSVRVESGGRIMGGRVSCGESGLSMRMFAPLAALADETVVLEARGGLRNRPMDMLRDLESFGVSIGLCAGRAPVVIKGPMRCARAIVENGRSSQVISGLIMALSQCEGASRIDFSGRLVSRPYVELTLDCMNRFGLEADLHDMHCRIPGGQRIQMPSVLKVCGDWSGAAFLLVAGALKGPLGVENLEMHSLQADEAVCRALILSGAKLERSGGKITVSPGRRTAFAFDAGDCPDLFPPLVVLAAASPGLSRIQGVSRLTIKECNRGRALVEMVNGLGGKAWIDDKEDSIRIEGGGCLRSGKVRTYGDHRMVMAAAVASLLTDGGVEVDDASCVAKSYPDFPGDFVKAGGEL